MIYGLGSDILSIQRIRKALQRYGDRFLARHLTEAEQQYCLKYQDPVPRIAGRFAGKEAIVKALGTGFRFEGQWLSIEIVNDALGKPTVLLHPLLSTHLPPSLQILLSISHCKEYAMATAIAIGTSHG